jgi:hypothetical protein
MVQFRTSCEKTIWAKGVRSEKHHDVACVEGTCLGILL